ncbi:MAG: rhomboid family intramembrane serine protease [Caldilineaceae bacterium]
MKTAPPILPSSRNRTREDIGWRPLPLATLLVVALTAFITTWQLWNPPLLSLLDRNLAALLAGQWWRLITPRLVQPEIWPQYFLLAILAVVGPSVERQVGSGRWMLFWLIGGLIGELVSFAWAPHGAGASVGICGIIGAWLVLALRQAPVGPWFVAVVVLTFVTELIGMALHSFVGAMVAAGVVAAVLIQVRQRTAYWPRRAPWYGMAGLLGGLILTLLRDQHGPPLLATAALAALLVVNRSTKHTQRRNDEKPV